MPIQPAARPSRCRSFSMPAPFSWAKRTWISLPRGSWARVHPTVPVPMPSIPGTLAEDRVPVRRMRWPGGMCPSRSARILPDRAESRPRSTILSVSSPRPDSSPSGVSFPPVPRLTVLLFWPSAAGTASVFSEAWPGWMRTISGTGLRGLHRLSPADPLPWASRTDWNFLAIRPGKTRSAKPSHGSPLWGGRCAPWILPRMKKRHPCCILAPTWQSARLFSGIS